MIARTSITLLAIIWASPYTVLGLFLGFSGNPILHVTHDAEDGNLTVPRWHNRLRRECRRDLIYVYKVYGLGWASRLGPAPPSVKHALACMTST